MRLSGLSTFLMVLGLLFAWSTALHAATDPAPASPDPDDEDPVLLEIEPPELEVGSRFLMTFQLPVGARYDTLEFEVPRQQAHLWRFGEPERTDTNRFAVEGRALLRGEHTLGPFEVTLAREDGGSGVRVRTDRLPVEVAPPEGDFTGELAGLSGPLGVPFDYFWRNVILGTGVVIGLVLLGWLGWLAFGFFRRQAARVLASKPPTPLEEALSAIRELKTGEELQSHGVERFYTTLSTILRRYLEREFDRPVLEMSDDETEVLLAAELSSLEHSAELRALLQRSSMAKFARQAVMEDQAMRDCGTVEQFLVSEEYRKKAEKLAERGKRPQAAESTEERAA